MTSDSFTVPTPLELPRATCPGQAAGSCRKATPRLWGWGSKVVKGEGGRGGPGAAPSSRAAVGPPARTHSAVPPKHKSCLLCPAPPPPPGCSNRQGHWLEPRPQPCRLGPSGGGGYRGSLPAQSPLLLRGPLSHFRIGSRLRAAAARGRSPVLEGDQQPGVQDVLLGFPRVISCKGKGRGTQRKKNRASFAASRWGMT